MQPWEKPYLIRRAQMLTSTAEQSDQEKKLEGTELQELRESLGLPLLWIAVVTDVYAHTVSAWETGKEPAPKKILRILEMLQDCFNALTRLAVEQYSEAPVETVAYLCYYNDADLWKYVPEFIPLPASCHRALIQRIVAVLTEAGAKAYAVYMLPIRYEAWRVENGLSDSNETRTMWALKSASEDIAAHGTRLYL
jgi:DNA-binding transcriptional regulator YiaG